MFKGSLVALVTPMHEDGTIDDVALEELIDWHIASGTNAIVVAGTTGESATLDLDEHFYLIRKVVTKVAGKIPVIAGTGTNSTKTTLKLTSNAMRAGADACLVVTPYYNKPTQNGLFYHYKTIADNSSIPLILYNVPGRTSCDLLPETVLQLADIKNIIGIKEASGKIERTKEILKRCDKAFSVWSGEDPITYELMDAGAIGVISVTANVAPKRMHDFCAAMLNGQKDAAKKINESLMLLHKNLFLESNPIPTKWALQHMGKIKSGIRLPLLPLDNKYHEEVKRAMQNAGV